MSERNAMHALAAGRIVGEVIKRVAEGDHPTTPAFTNEILEDALIEVHRLFTAEQAQLATAQERIATLESLDTSHLPYEKGWQDGRTDAWECYQRLAEPLEARLREAVEYLDSNPLNAIGARSILHRKMADALAGAKEGE